LGDGYGVQAYLEFFLHLVVNEHQQHIQILHTHQMDLARKKHNG
jgi:hypothetical protein